MRRSRCPGITRVEAILARSSVLHYLGAVFVANKHSLLSRRPSTGGTVDVFFDAHIPACLNSTAAFLLIVHILSLGIRAAIVRQVAKTSLPRSLRLHRRHGGTRPVHRQIPSSLMAVYSPRASMVAEHYLVVLASFLAYQLRWGRHRRLGRYARLLFLSCSAFELCSCTGPNLDPRQWSGCGGSFAYLGRRAYSASTLTSYSVSCALRRVSHVQHFRNWPTQLRERGGVRGMRHHVVGTAERPQLRW